MVMTSHHLESVLYTTYLRRELVKTRQMYSTRITRSLNISIQHNITRRSADAEIARHASSWMTQNCRSAKLHTFLGQLDVYESTVRNFCCIFLATPGVTVCRSRVRLIILEFTFTVYYCAYPVMCRFPLFVVLKIIHQRYEQTDGLTSCS